MENEVRIEARPWEPQDLIDDLQLMIDEEPDNYLNGNRTTLCMARDYLKKFFAEESPRPKGRWIHDINNLYGCSECRERETMSHRKKKHYCPNCGAKMEGRGMSRKKPYYKQKKWRIGGSFGWWSIPFCPHCKRQLGLMAKEQKVDKCPMCNKPLDWEDSE